MINYRERAASVSLEAERRAYGVSNGSAISARAVPLSHVPTPSHATMILLLKYIQCVIRVHGVRAGDVCDPHLALSAIWLSLVSSASCGSAFRTVITFS